MARCSAQPRTGTREVPLVCINGRAAASSPTSAGQRGQALATSSRANRLDERTLLTARWCATGDLWSELALTTSSSPLVAHRE